MASFPIPGFRSASFNVNRAEALVFTCTVSGIQELQRRMRALPNKLATRYLKQAVKAGAQKIADAAKQNAYRIDDPNTAENIAANISVQFASRATRGTGNVMYRVGVLGGAKQGTAFRAGRERIEYAARKLSGIELPGGETWYWRFVEFGTSHSRAQPFMQPAADSAGPAAAEEVATVLEQSLDKVVREL